MAGNAGREAALYSQLVGRAEPSSKPDSHVGKNPPLSGFRRTKFGVSTDLPKGGIGKRLRAVAFGALLAVALLCAPPARAVEPDEVLPDPALETRARTISTELRCLVCQNQSIDDSNAPLARDLRVLVRERLKAGDSDSDVIRYIVDRYGEFVLLRPAIGAHTLLLWLAPLAILLIAAGTIAWRLKRSRAANPQPAALSPEEQARLDALLNGKQ